MCSPNKCRRYYVLSHIYLEKWFKGPYRYLEYVWRKLPKYLLQTVTTISIFLMGLSANGDWVTGYIHFRKQFGLIENLRNVTSTPKLILESFYLKDIFGYCLQSVIFSLLIYYSIGAYIQWYFYIRRRDSSEEWKCQPNKWLTPDLERHEIFYGTMTLIISGSISGVLACYIANGGYSRVYYDINEYGWLWFILQFPVLFVWEDGAIYWMHRLYHIPFLYTRFHRAHHRYKQPTAFSATAIHPVEAIHIQLTNFIPMFIIPLHWCTYYCVMMYFFYHGLLNHSGVDFKSYWWQPWQPDAIFHDNHHQYYHVNFGFNLLLWDKMYGTYRRKDRVYRENIFYGYGKAFTDVPEEELKTECAERASENPNAHRDSQAFCKLQPAEITNLVNGKVKQL